MEPIKTHRSSPVHPGRVPGGAPWDIEKLYFSGDDYFKAVVAGIRSAKVSVEFEVYIYEKGFLGDRITRALVDAAGRGVRVRLLVDGVGSSDCDGAYGEILRKSGVAFKVYRRIPSPFYLVPKFIGSFFKADIVHRIKGLWLRMNRRDHRKLIIVDGTRVWLGGFNVSDLHLVSVAGVSAWRDTGLGLFGVRDRSFGLAFEAAWEDKVHQRLWRGARRKMVHWLSKSGMPGPVQINATRKLRRRFHHELLERLGSARRRIWVTTPYFVPTLPVLRALLRAASRGCDVRLVLPEKSDIPAVRWASMTFFATILQAGCRIFEYHKSVLHAKTLVVDDWALVGSSNFNHRSFLFDLEVDVVIRKDTSLKALEKACALDFKRSHEIFPKDLRKSPVWIGTMTWLFSRFRHWL